MTQQASDDTKTQLLTVRMAEDKYFEFKAAAAARGPSMSALVTQFAFQVIREAKRDMPDEFEAKLAEILAEKRASSAQESVVMESAPEEKEEALTAVNLLQAKPASPRRERYEATAYVEPEKKRGKK